MTGNLKFDNPPPVSFAFREELGFTPSDWIFVAASTHEGEEEAALDVLEDARKAGPDGAHSYLVLVPRRIERCE